MKRKRLLILPIIILIIIVVSIVYLCIGNYIATDQINFVIDKIMDSIN